jgi:hypothetical protein
MPFRTIWRKKADAVARLHAEFNQRIGQASDAPQELLRRNSFPAPVAAYHLGAGRRVLVDSPQESRRKRWIVHAIFECTLLRNLAQIAKVGSGSLSGNAVHPEFRRDRLRLIQLKANCKLNEDRNRLFVF